MTGLDLFWGLRVGDPADVVKLSHDGAAFVMHGIDYFPPRLSVFRVVYARRVEPLGALRVYVRRLSDDKACARLLGSLAIIVRVLFARIRVRIGTIPCQRGHDGSGEGYLISLIVLAVRWADMLPFRRKSDCC
jgi:hypothetical protein